VSGKPQAAQCRRIGGRRGEKRLREMVETEHSPELGGGRRVKKQSQAVQVAPARPSAKRKKPPRKAILKTIPKAVPNGRAAASPSVDGAVRPEEFLVKHAFDQAADPLTDLQFAFTRKMTFVVGKWIKHLNDEFRVIDQSQARWTALFWVASASKALKQRELADLIGVQGPTLARLLDRMEADGLIERRAAPGDRRAKTIYLTEAAKPMILQLARMSEGIRTELLSGIDPAELRTCISVFDRLIAKFD
jgi:MarR family transcriptional regulator for hemolysin